MGYMQLAWTIRCITLRLKLEHFFFYNKMHFSRSQSSNPPPNESYIAFSLRCPLLKIKKNFMRASMTFNLPPIEAQDYHFSWCSTVMTFIKQENHYCIYPNTVNMDLIFHYQSNWFCWWQIWALLKKFFILQVPPFCCNTTTSFLNVQLIISAESRRIVYFTQKWSNPHQANVLQLVAPTSLLQWGCIFSSSSWDMGFCFYFENVCSQGASAPSQTLSHWI